MQGQPLPKIGVVLAGEKRVTSKLLAASKSTEKMYKIDDHVACAVAGITADANILINTARLQAQRYTFAYQEPMPVEQLVQSLSDATHSLVASAPLGSPSFSLDMTRTLASNFT
ncbi:hypothetical protein GOP47_0014091 [Adiantum capillus-veneris]|uniref:Uncharacterized protein n=1 Tax=Adiantum capillus-veneris TaxID=13818 RepID=A0A9D4UQ19_ADICA|nr:hypothetical protein GOP47_0014091 [Adiantum capillus-veneris]